ncbi:hypothetical protein [Allorhodopirellula solitaria]|uniref:Uncharacterized protein n=1 Tax=Allorhodopirellula solitaria TaxID=2527987 RepID=A0A5C5XY91_9BACT|nr:hypothetical protein [Allorhodopirellula solitaria]TWT67491.1 hypothetical protein CA85_23420 [Allorhodopirellula solitaria]
MRSFQKNISSLAFLAIMTCGCGRSSGPLETSQIPHNQRLSQDPEQSGAQLTVKRNMDVETILSDLGLDAWAFEVTGVPWTWEVTISHRPKGKNRRSRIVYQRSYLESSQSFYAKNRSADSSNGAFGSVVLLLPDPVSPEQQFEEDLIITTKLGYDPTSGRGIGRRAVRETIRKPIKEIYPASVGSYTSRSENPRGSRRFAKISEGETVALVDEAHDFEHWDDRLPSDQRETIRIQLNISTLELE